MFDTSSDGSITRCIALLKRGDRDAAQTLWQRYIHRLIGLARARLFGIQRRAMDEEDIALSAFDSFFRRAERGQFARLEDRDDLWQLLFVLTVRKAANLAKRETRARHGGNAVLALSDLEGLGVDELLGNEPTPELAAQVSEECHRLLDRLGDDTLRRLAQRKLEGYTNAEIAAELRCVESTVERKLQRIRSLWAGEMEA
jgi:DNA-directed RNA polymerase specialized sigma24 family protein